MKTSPRIQLIVLMFFLSSNAYCLEKQLEMLATNLEQLANALKKPKKMTAPIPLPNLGLTCYMNSTIQVLLAIEPITELLVVQPNIYPPDSLAYAYVEFVKAIHNLPEQTDTTYTTALNTLTNNQLKKLAEKTQQQMGGCGQQAAYRILSHLLVQLAKNNSNVCKLIEIKQTGKLICPNIGYQEDMAEDWLITIPISIIEKNNTPITNLSTGFDNYFSEIPFDGVKIINGNPQTNCFFKNKIEYLSDFIIIYLDRSSEIGTEKIQDPVDIAQALNFEKYGIPKPDATYTLIASFRHIGGVGGGHYKAYVNKNGQWFICDDSTITPITFATIKNNIDLGNLFVYQRVKKQ